MNDRDSSHTDPDDLAWLADRFVLGELDSAETFAAEARLVEDEAFAVAVAQSSRLIAAVRAADPPETVTRAPWPRRRLATSALAAALCLVIALVLMPSRQPRPVPTDIVRFWRQADVPDLPRVEVSHDHETTDADIVPDWMLEAVALGADNSDVLEN